MEVGQGPPGQGDPFSKKQNKEVGRGRLGAITKENPMIQWSQHWTTEWIIIGPGHLVGPVQSSTAGERRGRRKQRDRRREGKKWFFPGGFLEAASTLQTVAPIRVWCLNIISGSMACNLLGVRFSYIILLRNVFLRSNSINVSALFHYWVTDHYVTLQLLSCEEPIVFNF